MRIRTLVLRAVVGTALVAVFATSLAFGERATALLDGVATALQVRLTAESALESPNPSVIKTRASSLRKLGKDTTSAAGDVKLLKKIVGPVLKKLADDVAITAAVTAAVDTADADVDDVIAVAQTTIDAAETGKKTKRAAKALAAAQKLLSKSRSKPNVKSRVALLAKARKKVDSALAQAEKLTPASGGSDDGPSRGHVIAQDENRAYRLMEYWLPAATLKEIDTGTGGISIGDPEPVVSPDQSIVAFV